MIGIMDDGIWNKLSKIAQDNEEAIQIQGRVLRLESKISDLERRFAFMKAYLGSELGFESDRIGSIQEKLIDKHNEVIAINKYLNGDNGSLGMKTKLSIVWYTYIWLLMGIAGVAGWFARKAIVG